MKSFIFLSSILLFYAYNSNSQIIENGDFVINSGNAGFGCGANTFIDGTVPNWWVTHGSPNFCFNLANCPNPHTIYMQDYGKIGEGIVGGYPFKKNETYIIHLGIVAVSNPSQVLMVAANGSRPNNTSCFTVTCGSIGTLHGKAPVTFSNGEEWIMNPAAGIGVSSLSIGNNTFTFTPTKDQDWVMIFPFTDNGNCLTEVEVDYVWITRQCKNLKEVDVFPNNSQWFNGEPYLTYYYRYIRVGSNLGTFPVATTNKERVILEATKAITLENVFFAEPATNKTFLAYINPHGCDILPPNIFNGGSGEDGESKMPNTSTIVAGGYLNNNNIDGWEKFKEAVNDKPINVNLSPNPAHDVLDIQLSGYDRNVGISIVDMTGKIVLSQKETGKANFSISISKLPSGMYYVQVYQGEKIVREKFVKY